LDGGQQIAVRRVQKAGNIPTECCLLADEYFLVVKTDSKL
jgi:hypothetical protein